MDELSPYVEILNAAGNEGKRRASKGALNMFLGTVVKANPITINVNSITVQAGKGNLWINPQLLAKSIQIRNTFSASTLNAPVMCGDAAGSVTSFNAEGSGVATIEADLKTGDVVVLLTRDQQSFYILCKEVPI